jgi:hypothetical protein
LFDWIEDGIVVLHCHITKMNMEQVMELLRVFEEKMDADRKADQEKMDANLREMTARLEAMYRKTDANQGKMDVRRGDERPYGFSFLLYRHMSREDGGHSSLHMSMAKRDDGMPRNNGGMSGMQGANVRGYGTRNGSSRGPQEAHYGEIFWSTEEASQGLVSGRGAPPEAKGKDPGKLWIPEGIDLYQQEDGAPCRSGMGQEKHRLEGLDQEQG